MSDYNYLVAQTPTLNNKSGYIDVLDELYSISEKAVASSQETLTLYKLPSEFLEIFLDIPGRRGGFCIISSSKLVVLFDEDPNLITVIGKIRNKESAIQNSTKSSQLLKVSFSKVGGKYKYKDNTGGHLDPYEIIALLTRWVVS